MRQAMGLPGGSSGRLSTCFFEGLAIRSSRNVENEVSHEVSGPPVHSDGLPNMRDRRVNAHAIGVPRQELGPKDDEKSGPLGARSPCARSEESELDTVFSSRKHLERTTAPQNRGPEANHTFIHRKRGREGA